MAKSMKLETESAAPAGMNSGQLEGVDGDDKYRMKWNVAIVVTHSFTPLTPHRPPVGPLWVAEDVGVKGLVDLGGGELDKGGQPGPEERGEREGGARDPDGLWE